MKKLNKDSEKKVLRLSIDKHGIGWMEWNETEHSVNVLSTKVLKELESLLPALKRSSLKALILISKNSKSFIAGADLRELQNIQSREILSQYLDRAHDIFNRFEALPATKIAVIHGACLGGGLELALTCDYRLASDSSSTRFGLPEVKLGLIPGFGGCFRLPRRLGLKNGLEMILSGRILPAKVVLKKGLLDEVIPFSILEKRGAAFAHQVIKGEKQVRPSQKFKSKNWKSILQERVLFRSLIFLMARRSLQKKTKGFYPAPLKALQVIKKTYLTASLPEALGEEKRAFLDVVLNPESRNLIRLFFLTRQAKKQKEHFVSSESFLVRKPKLKKVPDDSFLPNKSIDSADGLSYQSGYNLNKKALSFPCKVGVLGAGVMGGGIAHLSADKGQRVWLQDVKEEALIQSFHQARKFWKEQMIQGKIENWEKRKKEDRLSLTCSFSSFSKMDFIIETLPEDRDLKKKVLREIGSHLTPSQIFVSNTSSFSVGDLASSYAWPEQFAGMHFFNPVYKMPLVEIVKTDKSKDSVISKVFQWAKELGKIPVIVKDSPGFIVNRLLMPYLSEALWLLTEGHDVKRVDDFYTYDFGFPMGPFRLMDEVGLDLCLKVLQSFEKAGLSVVLPEGAKNILQDFCPGRKNGEGFYIYGKKSLKVSEKARGFRKSDIKSDSTECIHRGLYRMINEAIQVKEEEVAQEEDIDLAMVLGMGFPPFLGGPLKYARDKGMNVIVNGLRDFSGHLGPRFMPRSSFK